MKQLAGMIEPDLAIITLVAPAHLEELGDVEGVAREKAELPAAVRTAGVAVFPRHCEQFSGFRDLAVRRLVVEAADVVRPAAPPKDRVFFAVTQRGDSTALAIAYSAPPPLHFTLRRVSTGMAQNAVLAICAALWLGVPDAVIQERLAAWRPAQWRGELRRHGGRLVYLDCYNANPASMADALDNFEALAPAGQPRAYVLGCMEELGSRAADYHRELGRTLQLRPDDRLFIVGGHAAALREGVLENGPAAGQIVIAAGAAAVRPLLAYFPGAIFLKGSRRHHLEQALDLEEAAC
jgi:UDP-N-acetylmuramoyl-tripeptide--D-alanyl-D-alanine ligase